MRLALQVAYDGRGFNGWQIQPDRPSVQGVLERALESIAGHEVRVVCAGRTDTGVHGLGQIVHFDTSASRPASAWVRGVNAHLPMTVAVKNVWSVHEAFHARFSARSRRYRYLLKVSGVRDPLWGGRAGWVHRALDVAAMRHGAQSLIGRHDFSAFRAAQCQAATPVRTVSRLDLWRRGDWVGIEVEADAFLHHMVRNIVGALVDVGSGAKPVSWISALLASADRRLGPATFAADGLYFVGPCYGGAGEPVVTVDPVWPVGF